MVVLAALSGRAAGVDGRLKLIEQLHGANATTALDAAEVAPWHMKMAVQVFDAKGLVAEQGLIEEWWAGPRMDRIVYSVPSYKATELQNGAGFFRSKGAEQPRWMICFHRLID